MSPNSNSLSVQVCLLANALVHRLSEEDPLLSDLETNTQINTEVCDDGRRDTFASGRCPGTVLRLYTGLQQSCIHKQEGSLSSVQSQTREMKTSRAQRLCFLLLPWSMFVSLGSDFTVGCCEPLPAATNCKWWVSPVILVAESSVRGPGNPFLPRLRLQPFVHQPASPSRQSAQKVSPAP